MDGTIDRSWTTRHPYNGRTAGRSVFTIFLDQLEIQDGTNEQFVPR